jgi:signal transduction histidine kinase/ActR/RegA family two-component response regulator/PAS domain-containing protein
MAGRMTPQESPTEDGEKPDRGGLLPNERRGRRSRRRARGQKPRLVGRGSRLLRTAGESPDAAERREAWLLALTEGLPVGIAALDRELGKLRVNAALAAIRSESPSIVDELMPRFRQVLDSGESMVDFEIVGKARPAVDGEPPLDRQARHFEVSIYPIVVRGVAEGVVGMVKEITQQRREDHRRVLLAKASEVFAASLALEPTLQGISDLFVPECADWASVYVRGDDDEPRLAATTYADPTKEPELLNLFAKNALEISDSSPCHEALATGRSHIVGDFDVSPPRDDAAYRGWLSRMRAIKATSFLAVPMTVHGQTIGVLSLGSYTPERALHAEEIPVVEEVARRAAIAIENARLFELAQTERRRADEANRAKDEFLAVVSHELRTPLNAIMGWARMLTTSAVPEERAKKAFAIIERNAVAQAKLIEDLLDISRIITGKLRLELQPVESAAVVRAAIESVAPAADGKGVAITASIDESVGTVVWDGSRLQQAIWNLLTNAVKFTPKGGEVVVCLARDGAFAVVSVEDNGEGIDPRFVGHAFERFKQADMGSTRRHGGLGLGLSIVRHIAELHGGHVDVASAGKGRGSTFRLTIPLLPQQRSKAPALKEPLKAAVDVSPPTSLAPSIRGLQLLVVDDEADARDLLATMLTDCGAVVVTAASAEQALLRFHERRPDVVISDIGMPDHDGYDLLERIRSLPASAGGKVPAVALTAYARPEDRSRALTVGFDEHVTKPAELAELVTVVARVAVGVRRFRPEMVRHRLE